MALKLKLVLTQHSITYRKLGQLMQAAGGHAWSAGSIAQIVNHGFWPKGTAPHELQRQIRAVLIAAGVPKQSLAGVFSQIQPKAGVEVVADATPADSQPDDSEEIAEMLLRKQPLTPEARRHFKIARDPFTDEMESSADVYLSDDIRYVRAAVRQCAKHGGMLAVIGESGAGKTTVKRDLKEWITEQREPITVIEPYVLGVEDGDTNRRNQALRAQDIASSIIRAVDRLATVRQTAQARSEQLHELLRASAKAGQRHVLVIEEAHDLPTSTLKHLKRFYELEPESGFGRLLAILLIGQTELAWKLDDRNPRVREVVQRTEIATLGPLDGELQAYLQHKFARVDMKADAIFEASAIDEMRARLQAAQTVGRGQARRVVQRSICYPLAVNNLASIALNQAARIGAKTITGELIAAAVRSQQEM
ncbi:putative secretion ATPase%2C PEP-CTERM locus subfamily [Bordetella ansorpii]|uniref:Putative secretion ATPase, PEP-CTERM locus subfamily n=1 Tax=Bordetella ansorpii TaxID=288768 RepID=A0A157SVV3_9BORD|nr:AAA family ATPase [Bordetella ansorpii]SAI74590.1 putative secretion ATPase%2C PEP-CTERM locus subfamily [Bordetella ansorpii]